MGTLKTLRAYHYRMMARLGSLGVEIPENSRHHRDRDCAVFNYLYDQFRQEGKPIDSARAVYVPTDFRKWVWKGSWIDEEAHIQIGVRNPQNILAVWHVRPGGTANRRKRKPKGAGKFAFIVEELDKMALGGPKPMSFLPKTADRPGW